MEKIDIDLLKDTDDYKRYVQVLKSSNNMFTGFDIKHTHLIDGIKSSQSIGYNFFLHTHYVSNELSLEQPCEYDPKTLEHRHNITFKGKND